MNLRPIARGLFSLVCVLVVGCTATATDGGPAATTSTPTVVTTDTTGDGVAPATAVPSEPATAPAPTEPATEPTSSVVVSDAVPTMEELFELGLTEDQAVCFRETIDPNGTGRVASAELFAEAFSDCLT